MSRAGRGVANAAPATVRAAAADVERRLAVLAPELVEGFRAALPAAAASVGARLLGALWREDVGDTRARYAGRGHRHGFDRVDFAGVVVDEPGLLLPGRLRAGAGRGLAAELANAVVNLALAYARGTPVPAGRPALAAVLRGGGADAEALRGEWRAVEGHNLHPCGRTRLGWDVGDALRHDLEAGATDIGFVAVRRGLLVGDDVGAALGEAYPQVPAAPAGFVVQPVHAWQLATVLPRRYGELIADGLLRPLEGRLPAAPTGALRTLLLPAGRDGRRRYVKVSLDILVTSTRRSVSLAATRNGPVLSRLLRRLLDDDPAGDRVLLLPETAGAGLVAGSGRDCSALLRGGLDHRLGPGESAVAGTALTAGSTLAELVDRYGRGRGVRGAAAARAFVEAYARLLLPPLLRLLARYGVAVEAHLQNCLPTFVDGAPCRLVLRDFAGLRLHRPRLAAAGLVVPLWPGSVIGTDDVAVARAKLGYTALQAHLGELVARLCGSHGLDEAAAWRSVREVLDEVYEGLGGLAAARADHAAFTAAWVPHKALVRMRLAGDGDRYVPVRNPLHVA